VAADSGVAAEAPTIANDENTTDTTSPIANILNFFIFMFLSSKPSSFFSKA
jgi:hypothetical protein